MATEKRRLIDANAALEELCKYCSCGCYEECEERCVEFRDISKIPTVDAVEVVHGKWELRSVTSGMNGRYWCCSACGCIRSYWEYKAEDNYCFKCGAKMDGERRTNERKAD